MFNRYWREYPWYFQLFQFILMLFISASFFMFCSYYLVPMVTGVDVTAIQGLSENSDARTRIATYVFQLIAHSGTFMIPSALFAYATHPRPFEYLGIRMPEKSSQWLIVTFLMLSAIPIISGIAALLDKIELTGDWKEMKDQFAASQKGILGYKTFGEFIMAFLVLAIVPAIGEELLFRGILMRFAAKRMKRSIAFPILITATLFALMHWNIIGFVSLLIAGVLLGLLYYLTGSLLLAIWGHLIVNGTQLVLIYIATNNKAVKDFNENNDVPITLITASVIVFVISLYLLWKNRTPLPGNWTDDFTQKELEELSEDRKRLY